MVPAKESKKGGFSAFIRRLTKRKPNTSAHPAPASAKLGVKDVNVQVVQQPARTGTVSKAVASAPSRAPLAPVVNEHPEASVTVTRTSVSVAPATAPKQLLSPAQSIASAHRLATATSTASSLGVPPADVDPVNVPLPPSPNIPDAPVGLGSPVLGTAEPPVAVQPLYLTSPHLGLPRSRSASPRASPRPVPGTGASRAGAVPAIASAAPGTGSGHGQDEESVETIDEVRPLESLRIITRARSMSPGQAGPLSAGGSSIADTVLQTPCSLAASPPLPVSSLGGAMGAGGLGIGLGKEDSDGEMSNASIPEEPRSLQSGKAQERQLEPTVAALSASDEEGEEMRDDIEEIDYLETPMYAGSSPPRKAPIGNAPVSLGRKGSKWRKSVMGLSDVGSPLSSVRCLL